MLCVSKSEYTFLREMKKPWTPYKPIYNWDLFSSGENVREIWLYFSYPEWNKFHVAELVHEFFVSRETLYSAEDVKSAYLFPIKPARNMNKPNHRNVRSRSLYSTIRRVWENLLNFSALKWWNSILFNGQLHFCVVCCYFHGRFTFSPLLSPDSLKIKKILENNL